MHQFDYVKVNSVEDLLSVMDRLCGNFKIIAGATDSLVQIKDKIIKPKYVIDISKIAELNYIYENENYIEIGALVKHCDVIESGIIKNYGYALVQSCSAIGSPQVRNMGTVVGNIVNASPAADTAVSLMVLNSQVKVVSRKKDEWLEIEKLFVGPGLTILDKDEIITAIRFPKCSYQRSYFYKIGRRDVLSISIVNGAVSIVLNGNIIDDIKIAVGAVAPTPIRLFKIENMIKGKPYDNGLIDDASIGCREEIFPITDIRSTKDYRKDIIPHLISTMIKGAIGLSSA